MMRHYAAILVVSIGLFVSGYLGLDHSRPRVVFLDVGQGDAIYIRAPSGHDILIDAGYGSKILGGLAANMPRGDRKIELAIGSHFDLDHVGGYKEVLNNYEIGTFITNGQFLETDKAEELIGLLNDNHVPIETPKRGQRIQGAGFYLDILWPSQDLFDKSNDQSLVVTFVTPTKSVLLTGDISEKVDAALLADLTPLRTDILKVAHHGSKTSSSESFLRATDAGEAVISVGVNNWYGHPTREVLDRLSENLMEIHRTDQEGAVTMYFD